MQHQRHMRLTAWIAFARSTWATTAMQTGGNSFAGISLGFDRPQHFGYPLAACSGYRSPMALAARRGCFRRWVSCLSPDGGRARKRGVCGAWACWGPDSREVVGIDIHHGQAIAFPFQWIFHPESQSLKMSRSNLKILVE